MLEALKNSPEKKELVDAALKYLRGVKGTLVQQKKRDREKAAVAKGTGGPGPGQMATVIGGGARPSGTATTGVQGNAVFANANANANGNAPGLYQSPFMPAGAMPATATPGSVGSVLMGQLTAQQQRAQMQAQGMNDHQVESALRGFLGGN